ncbi:Cysteine-rich RLK (RECEPTOR-like protein kinase) 8 [Theobroma cacao]|uniref:Cysteine-rich RLK (RECEPTOR-like protein kinase) 8 n=1 Tax=Theobroma cacao TaxID=3641 RepID=A0A061EET8_THECC|nr:Cysteine-rich RLK (RECEPTOR-like protein kinase) 8 [Theobroma cacao]
MMANVHIMARIGMSKTNAIVSLVFPSTLSSQKRKGLFKEPFLKDFGPFPNVKRVKRLHKKKRKTSGLVKGIIVIGDTHELGETGCSIMCTIWGDAHELGLLGPSGLCLLGPYAGHGSKMGLRHHHHQKSHFIASSSQPSIVNSKVCGIILKTQFSQNHNCFSASHNINNAFIFNHNSWIVDTGATDHIACSLHSFTTFKSIQGVFVELPNNAKALVTHIGIVQISPTLQLDNVLFVPSFKFNLISVSQLSKSRNHCLIFTNKHCIILEIPSWTMIGVAEVKVGLHLMQCKLLGKRPQGSISASTTIKIPICNSVSLRFNLWHHRLRHILEDKMKQIKQVCPDIFFKESSVCYVCPLAKQKHLPFLVHVKSSKAPFDLIHTNIWGPYYVNSIHRYQYFLTIVDDFTRFTWVFLMRFKYDVVSIIPSFFKMVKNQFNSTIKEWVYKVKLHANGIVERYKAKLVAQVFTQKERFDYNEQFSSVAKHTTVQMFFALAAIHGWYLSQLDINNAFLYGDLHEDVYMNLPQGYMVKEEYPSNVKLVCKLHKSLYGIKQASRQWNTKVTECLMNYGFVQSKADYSLFTKISNDGFIDDIVIASSSLDFAVDVKTYLEKSFKLKDLGTPKYFLGLEIARLDKGMLLCQRKYVLDFE